MRSKYLVLFSLIFLVMGSSAKAQSIVTGAISGTVTDPSGAVVSDATVTLVNEATRESQSTATGATGSFQFSLLKPGRYALTIAKAGFRRVLERPEVLLGQT